MGLTKRDVWYAEFPVSDNGQVCRYDKLEGKLTRFTTRTRDRKQAEKVESLIFGRLLAGTEPSKLAKRKTVLTFNAWAVQYLELEHVKALRSKQRAVCVEHLKKFFSAGGPAGDKPLRDITAADVRQYRAWRAAQGVAVQTVNHDHSTLSTMLNVAMSEEFGLIERNVAAMVAKPNPHNERDRVATPGEWEAIKAVAAPHLSRFLTIAYDLGPRRGELLLLKWQDVNMFRREFTLRETKNGEARTVPMTDEVYITFRELWEERRLDTQRVFLYNGKPITSFKTAFKAACKRAGVVCGRKNGGLTVHDFRHTASTNLRRAGVDTMTAMKIVGHKSEKMHRRYNQITADDLANAAAKLNARKEAI